MGNNIQQQLSILINTESDLSGLNKAIGGFKRLEQLGKAGLGLNKAGRIIDLTTKKFVGLSEAAMRAEKTVAKFDMRLLSVLFGSMALKRVGESFFRFAFNSWDRYEGYQSASLDATMRLTAAWEFFRFSIFNALGQSDLFVGFIDFVVNGINMVSGWINKFPELATAMALVFGALAATGTIGIILSQFKLGWDALFGAGGFLSTSAAKGMGTVAGEAGTVTGAVSTAFLAAKNIIAGGLIFYGVFKLVEGLLNPKEMTGKDAILAALTVGLGTLLKFNPVAGFIAGGAVLLTMMYQKGKVLTEEEKRPEDMTLFERTSKNLFTVGSPVADALTILAFPLRFALEGFNLLVESMDKIPKKTDAIDIASGKLNDTLVGHSLVPSMALLNEQLVFSNAQNIQLIENYPKLTEQTNIHSTSVSALAAAYERLARAMSAKSTATNSRDKKTSSVFG